MAIREDIKSLIFYSNEKCLFCLQEKREIGYICSSCLEKLEYVDKEIEINGNKCFYPYYYNSFLKEIFHKYKFKKASYLAKAFSDLLVNYMYKKDLLDFDLIIYVPISNKRKLDRGYNQVELLCEYISKSMHIDVLDALKKNFETKEQNKIGKTAREENLIGSIGVKKYVRKNHLLENKKVLVIDDLVTTGNTLMEIDRVLENENINKINYLLLASTKNKDEGKD